MFQDSLFSSGLRPGSGRVRWAATLAAGVQLALLGLVLLLPLLHPAMLPIVSAAPRELLLGHIQPAPRPVVARAAPVRTARLPFTPSPALPAMAAPPTVHPAGPRLLTAAPGSDLAAPAVEGGLLRMGDGAGAAGLGLASLMGPAGPPVRAVPKPSPAAPGRIKLSSGVIAGLLLAPITPQYPAIARAAHVGGTVVLRATIDRDGRIRDLAVISGPEMLRGSALEAVARARYRPYRLNGDPTEVETTISVNFVLGT